MFIYEVSGWPNFSWDSQEIEQINTVTNRDIGYLYGRLSSLGFDSQMAATVEVVTKDVVSSSEIEGISLNTEQVRSSVARKLGVKIKDEKEPTHYIDGVVEMMLDAIMNHNKPISHDRLFGWHSALFPTGRSGYEIINVGKYRTEGIQVISGAFGKEKVHYRAPEADRIKDEMDKFIDWFNKTPSSLIKSAIAHFWFVCIHPFDDGNGRIGRAIADMALSQVDDSKFRLFSMSSQISKEKKDYYKILEQTSRGDSLDITSWIKWYLECLNRSVAEADGLFNAILNKAVFWKTHSKVIISERQQKVLNTYLDGYGGKMTVKNWAKIAEISPDTAARDINDLVNKGVMRPTFGRVRDIPYNLIYTEIDLSQKDFSEAEIICDGGKYYIKAIYKGKRILKDKLSEIDQKRYSDNELTIKDLINKYFAYAISGI